MLLMIKTETGLVKMSLTLGRSDTRCRIPGSRNPTTRNRNSVAGQFVYH